jgi:hypothetical protein
MNEDSGEFSEGLDEFEKSFDESKHKNLKNQTTYTNKPYDEAFEVSQDLSMAESFDGRDKVIQNVSMPQTCHIFTYSTLCRIPRKRS